MRLAFERNILYVLAMFSVGGMISMVFQFCSMPTMDGVVNPSYWNTSVVVQGDKLEEHSRILCMRSIIAQNINVLNYPVGARSRCLFAAAAIQE